MSVWRRPRPARAGESTRATHYTYVVRWRLGGTRDGAWQNVTVGGTRGHAAQAAALDAHVASLGGNTTKAEAVAWLRGTTVEPEPDDDDVPTVRAALEAWAARPGLSDNSRHTYRAALGRLGDLGDLRADQLTRDRVTRWFARWEQLGHSTLTLDSSRRAIKGACKRWCPADAFADLAFVPEAERTPIILTAEQVRALVTTARTRTDGTALAVWFVAELGVRWGEMAGLKAGDVDLTTGEVHIRRQLTSKLPRRAPFATKRLKTGSKAIRTLQMSPALAEALALVADLDPDAAVFAPPYGDSWRYMGWHRAWSRLVVAAGLPADLNTHDLRHTAAMRWLRAGVPLPLVSRRLGHANTKITDETYSHWLSHDFASYTGAGLSL